jgi:hypothetical protein
LKIFLDNEQQINGILIKNRATEGMIAKLQIENTTGNV